MVNTEDKALNKDDVKDLLKEILCNEEFKEVLNDLFKVQTNSILQIISSNHKIENDKIDRLTAEVRASNAK